jgi:hypothetical protein
VALVEPVKYERFPHAFLGIRRASRPGTGAGQELGAVGLALKSRSPSDIGSGGFHKFRCKGRQRYPRHAADPPIRLNTGLFFAKKSGPEIPGRLLYNFELKTEGKRQRLPIRRWPPKAYSLTAKATAARATA